MQAAQGGDSRYETITPLLNKLARFDEATHQVDPDEIAQGLSLLLNDKLTETQSSALLSLLHHKKKDRDVSVIAAAIRRIVQPKIDAARIQNIISTRGKPEGDYLGGLCELTGTGGNATPTLAALTTTASLIASSSLLVSQHGYMGANSPTADLGNDAILSNIQPTPPALSSTPENIDKVLKESNYIFLPEPSFYPTMKHANSIRQGLGIRTIFDLVSTLLHPLRGHLEARVIGVSNPDLGPAFAQALKDTAVKKALVVSGQGLIDRISPQGSTSCWMLSGGEGTVQHFNLQPSDFGLPEQPFGAVKARSSAAEEAGTLVDILQGKLEDDDPVLQIVLMHAAALLVISGICEVDSGEIGQEHVIEERGPGGQRWKEGIRRAKYSIASGGASTALKTYIRAPQDSL
ncbi:glycosyl transferase [Aspergillus avenaceus]|uniref:Glycosyl transferase n=1 Tax=Aspergillus avenaceus TaxID=36643 RepID=A0A5N6TVZ6_ASPAV|nr:glycosyl transferase [Aspergillus avenaceus]